MKGTLTKIVVGTITVISGGAYVPIIPSELEAGLPGVPDLRAYQYEAGSDRTDWRLVEENGTTTLKSFGMLPDADFTDEDGNGIISVGVFTSKDGQAVYTKIPDSQYAEMGKVNGSRNNPQKSELVSLLDSLKPKAVEAAIAFNSTSTSWVASASSLTYSHTTGGSDRAIVVHVFAFNSAATFSSMTYNGTTVTTLGSRVADVANSEVRLHGIANPTTGANNIVITYSASKQIWSSAVSYTGVDQTTPFPDTTVTGTVTGTSLSASITTTVDQSWLVLGGRSPSRLPTAGASTKILVWNTSSPDATWMLDSNGGRSTGSNALNWSYSPSQTTYYVMSVIAPAAEVATGIAPGADSIIYY